MSAAISAEGIAKAFRLADGAWRWALQGVDLQVQAGEFVCLLGPSGCGKTTLLRVLAGLMEPDAGVVQRQPQARLAVVFQEPRLLPWLTVARNLELPLQWAGVADAGERRRRAADWLSRVGLTDYAGYYPGQLSQGMQQRVAVARALSLRPALVLMDEPFSAFDELTARGLRDELLRLWQESGAAILFVTHNPFEAVYLADRILLMSGSPGRIKAELRVFDAYPRPRRADDPRVWALAQEAIAELGG